MSSDLKEQILDLIYDLLPEDQVESLRVRIEKEPEVRAIYESLMRKNRLLDDATRLEPEKSLFPVTEPKKREKSQNPLQSPSQSEQETDSTIAVTRYGKATRYIHAPHPKKQGFQRITREIARRALGEERGINRMVSIGAICLILLSFLGLVFQKNQVDKLSERSLLYRIAAPPVLLDDQTQTLQVQVSDLVGRPQQIPVRVAVNTLDGEKILAQTQKTDQQGNIILALDARKDLPAAVELEVSIGENPDKKIVSRLPVIRQESQLAVALDKPLYNPDDHVRYRVFNLTQFVPASEHQKLNQRLAQDDRETLQKPSEKVDVWISNETPVAAAVSGLSSGNMGMGSMGNNGMGGMRGGGMSEPSTYSMYPMQNVTPAETIPTRQVIAGSVPLDNPSADSQVMFLNIRPEHSQSQLVQTSVPVAQQTAPQPVPDRIASRNKMTTDGFSIPVPSIGDARGMLKAPPISSSAPAPMSMSSALDVEAMSESVPGSLSERDDTLAAGFVDEIKIAAKTLPLEVDWVPAGGRFALELENTVYFKANRPFRGNLVDQTGKTVTTIEAGTDHFGEFRWTPKSGNAYQLQTSDEELPDQRIPLDWKFESLPVSLDIEHVLLSPDESIAVNLNARQNDFPVIVTVLKQGIPVAAQAEVLSRGLNVIAVPLPKETHGLLDVMILEGASDTLRQPLARQSVFRRPDRFLDVNAKSKATHLQNGNASWNFDVQVLNETGKPAAYSVVGVNVIQDRTNNDFSRKILSQQPTLFDQLFFSALDIDNWERFDAWLNAPDSSAEARLKFFLAGNRTDPADYDEQTFAAIRPLIFDNFSQLQSQYHEKVSHFQQARNSWMRVFMIIGVFGGMGFAVLVMILVTLRLASAVRMFVLTAIVGLSCVFLCLAMLKNQATFSEAFQKNSFASHRMIETGINASQTDDLQIPLSASSALIRTLPVLHRSHSPFFGKNVSQDQQSVVEFENVLWQPELRTDAQGRVPFDFLVTDAKDSAIRVMIDAFDENGRIGSCRIYLPQTKNEE